MKFLNKKAKLQNEIVDVNSTENQLYFLKNYVHQLDSLYVQNRISPEQYQAELCLINNQVTELERKNNNESISNS